MSKEERLRRFFSEVRDTDDWEKDYAKGIAFVEREGGVMVTEDYPHLKLLNQLKYFAEFRTDEFKTIGKMIGCIK